MSAFGGHETRAGTRRWILDTASSTVEFRVGNFWGLTTVIGSFSRFNGSYTVGEGGAAIELTVDATSLETGNGRRDDDLRSSRFFDVETHPRVRFVAQGITDIGEGRLDVRGELEAAGKTVPLSFQAIVRESEELEIEATTLVDQRRFGMTWSPLRTVRWPSTLHVIARLIPTASRDQPRIMAAGARANR